MRRTRGDVGTYPQPGTLRQVIEEAKVWFVVVRRCSNVVEFVWGRAYSGLSAFARSPAMPKSRLIFYVALVVGCLICTATSTVAGGRGTSNERGVELSLLDYDHILLPGKAEIDEPPHPKHNRMHSEGNRKLAGLLKSRTISLDGFNLLWLIASKLQAGDGLIRMEHGTNSSSGANLNDSLAKKSSPASANEVYLDSTWPRPYLRYGKKSVPLSRVLPKGPGFLPDNPAPVAPDLSDYLDSVSERPTPIGPRPHSGIYDNNIVRINRFIAGSSIGFEMEFRMEQHSGSGYIITGRSLIGQPYFAPGSAPKYGNDSSNSQSWFGLFSQARVTSYSLRLEYRNFAWHRKRQLQIRFSDNFRKGEWQKLAVNIDFNANTINYWVNCSARPLVQLRANISHPSSFYSVYRLLQHRRRTTLPVKVTFREAVVTDGHRRTVPSQCRRERMSVCTGGKVYMACGPSCERTCRGVREPPVTDDYLRTCAIACVAGCRCRPGYVSYDGACVKPEQCPCLFGITPREAGSNLTINNEICTCVKGRWNCYRVPEMTQKPKNLTVNAGRSVQLTCGVSGNPQPTITWETPAGASYQIVSKDFGRLSILVLLNVTEGAAGLYRCRASLTSTNWERIATSVLRVESKPVITLPQTITVSRGHPVLAVECLAAGLPKPGIRWRRNGKIVVPGERIEIHRDTPGVSRLKIHNVQNTDAGPWSCLAYNVAGYSFRTVTVLVRLNEPTTMAFYRIPVDQYVKRGHTAIFNCEILNHHSSLNVTWMKNGVRLDLSGKRIVTKRYRLLIRQVRDEDAGVYTCVVKVRRGGREFRAKAELMIKGQMLAWSDWSHCSATCGAGIMFKRRTCTGIPPNEKTCHGKTTHMKSCNTQACPGVCSAVGDPHYTTFDGRRFNFHGDCGYVLSHDASGNEFKVLLYNGKCGNLLSCLNTVTVILTLPGLAAVVDIHRDGFVTVNSVHVSLPYTSAGTPLIIDKIGLFIVLNAGPEFEIKWALPHRLYLIVGPKYFGRTQGFCGNYNGDPTDDNIVRSGRSVTSELEFGLDWAVSQGNIDLSCSVFELLSQPCDRDDNLRETAVAACSYLSDQRTFGPCHAKVPRAPFIEACKFDICRTSIKRTNIYFCTALSAYAEECLRKGLVLDWRTHDICPQNCFSGTIYEECGPRCKRYCPGVVNESGRVCVSNDRCVSGCHCPRDMALHKGRCVVLEQCPCIDDGLQFENGTTHNRDCEKCICFNGRWKCSFNKDLCEFPASIVRGPISRIAPTGKAISFCCEAAGIPTPTVEWYRGGRLIPPQTQSAANQIDGVETDQDGPVHGYARADLIIQNLTKIEAGSYSCKATNALGAQYSEPASLSVVEPWVATCNPTPSKRVVNLPEGCNYDGASYINVGYCPSLPCFYENPTDGQTRSRKKKRCGGTKQCCRPSMVKPVTINCNYNGNSFSHFITTVRQCSCAICETRYTFVEGALVTAFTGKLLSHVKIDYQGRVVGYTSETGSFHIRFLSLPEETRFVALTFTDIMYKRFPATVKNLPIIVGVTTTHKVVINERVLRAYFDASLGLRHVFRSAASNKNERLRIIIPPSSLMLHAGEPYVGRVQAVISIVERDYEIDKRRLHTIPGNFVGIDRMGSKRIVLPSYVVSVSLYNQFGRPLELLHPKSATFLVTTISFGQRIQPWVLDELTGLWREPNTKVRIEPQFNKRGEKVLQLTVKIKRLNTAWALSDSEEACFVRVRVLDKFNNTVSGVRVSMTTAREIPRPTGAPGKRFLGDDTQMQTFAESLTRGTDANGVCMPIGCTKFGFISASKLADDLNLLRPDDPPPEMGRVVSRRSHNYIITAGVSRTSNDSDIHSTRLRPNSLYFSSERECKETAAGKRTYVFRDIRGGAGPAGHSAGSRDFPGTSSKQAFGFSERKMRVGRRSKTFCHVKVSISTPERVSYFPRRTLGALMILEAVTFSGRNNSEEMSILGWRRATFRTPTRRTSYLRYGRLRLRASRMRVRRVTKEVCAEYVCGEEDPAVMVYVNVKPAKDSYSRGRTPLSCEFLRSANASRTSSGVQVQFRPGKATKLLSKGGYVVFPPWGPNSRRVSRRPNNLPPDIVFPAKSLIESKNKCLAARGGKHVSAWVRCS